ncbi:KR domain-containing protein [Enhygromyxa salina]|uniref:Phthiocerol/phenolphthiocerol synthesis polyketide synthase type I PpsA n=1 Tax=Enhygromyxa salina TaxID=215803 RepID=A0A2S9XL44_9BACT|nr:KR domain-containing protein [Enhygromyxa salina]PRP93573.1 Phthiocerol/phenolphthiocerol synthesis polyketide synthase type I PpsA [Enhygromyxa salina]
MDRTPDALFEIVWTPIEPSSAAPPRRDRALILAGDEQLADALQWAGEQAGISVSVMGWRETDLDDETTLDAKLRACAYDEVWLVVGQPRLQGRALAPAQLDELLRRGPGTLAACARSLVGLAAEGQPTPRLRVISCGACAVERSALDLAGAFQAPAWGLARAIWAEHPELDLALVDLDPQLDPDRAAAAFVTRPVMADDERELALRGSSRLAPRLVPTLAGTSRVELDPDAAYLVVGGLGRLGREIARGLVERGARRLVMVGVRVLAGKDRELEFIAELELAGATVELARVDIRDRAALTALRREREAAGRPPIRGVVHAAMGDDAGRLVTLEPRTIGESMALEVAGTWNLHAVFGQLVPFLSCTSVASLVPGLAQGRGCQAAGHAFVHALMTALRARGSVAAAIAFGPWHDSPQLHPLPRRCIQAGFGVVDRSLAAEAVDAAITTAHAQLVCAPIDHARIDRSANPRPALLERLLADAPPRPAGSLVSFAIGQGRPLFLLHPQAGETSCYAALVDRLTTTRPLVGVRASSLVDREWRPQSLAEIAAEARRTLRRVQPAGPLDLLGWGFGGALAFEIARQELEQDRGVGLVAMHDSHTPSPRAGQDELDLLVAFLADLGQLDAGDRRNLAARSELEHAPPDVRLDLLFRLAHASKLVPATLELDGFVRRVEVFVAHARALADWRPRTLDATVHYFAPSGRATDATDHAHGWLPRVAELVTHRVPRGRYALTTDRGAAAVAEVLLGLL